MILFNWGRAGATGPGVALLYGSGLIGGAVINALKRAVPDLRARHFPWTWPRPDGIEVASVETAVRDALAPFPGTRLSVLWAAGRSGFGTDTDGMAEEFAAFEGVLETAMRIGADRAPEQRSFIHVSSAGGLFEGQVACGMDAAPAPLRPYGHGKFVQEHRILDCDDLGHRFILRPSSVYGFSLGARRGLVSALLAAGIQRQRATIFGSLTTQRDYVFAPDVGRFAVDRLLAPRTAPAIQSETSTLASGRPASVFEILRIVEEQLGTPLCVRIDPWPENARDTTFLPSSLPEDFKPTSLREGVALTATAVMQERYLGEVL